MTYDSKCYELAMAILDEKEFQHIYTGNNTEQLAELIQTTIEDFIREKLDNYEPPDDPIAWSGGFAPNH